MEEEYVTISNEELRAAFNEIYNVWFKHWKINDITAESQWMLCINELNQIIEKHKQTLPIKIGIAMIEELNQRQIEKKKGG